MSNSYTLGQIVQANSIHSPYLHHLAGNREVCRAHVREQPFLHTRQAHISRPHILASGSKHLCQKGSSPISSYLDLDLVPAHERLGALQHQLCLANVCHSAEL